MNGGSWLHGHLGWNLDALSVNSSRGGGDWVGSVDSGSSESSEQLGLLALNLTGE